MDIMRWDVGEMENVCITNSWVDVYNGDVISNSSIMHVMNQRKNVGSIVV